MFDVFKNAWKVEDIREKLLYTLLIIVVFRLGAAIPVPFLDASALSAMFGASSGNLLGYLNMLTGGALSMATVFALSISPYITASIVIQLLTIAIPALEKLAKEGNEDSRQKLILHNLRLVSHIVRKYYSNAPDSEDLVSIGVIGLVKAVDTFKCETGIRFATYAARCIQNEILMHFRAQKKRATDVSLAETIDIDRDGNPLTYMDILCTTDNLGDELDKKTQIERAIRLVHNVLDDREKQIITMRYGLFGISKSYTQKEIAEKLNISRSYVSRIEKSAIDKLREKML